MLQLFVRTRRVPAFAAFAALVLCWRKREKFHLPDFGRLFLFLFLFSIAVLSTGSDWCEEALFDMFLQSHNLRLGATRGRPICSLSRSLAWLGLAWLWPGTTRQRLTCVMCNNNSQMASFNQYK